jgi:5-methylcytosine-specific restriction endonuclease McrA
MICSVCKTIYFNNNPETLKKKAKERKELKNARFELVKNKYFGTPARNADDMIERMTDVVNVYKTAFKARRMLLRIFRIYLPKDIKKQPHNFSQSDVLKVMQFLANQDLTKKSAPNLKPLAQMRDEYNIKKFTPSWRPHVSDKNCYICRRRPDIRHHLIPLKNGGSNSHLNIRSLCNPCHAEIHPWLK